MRIVIIGFLLAFSLTVSASNEVPLDGIYSKSLAELLSIKVTTGTLTSFSAKYSPSAITTIQKDQISLSTAKNLAGLLEQYVPGMMLMAHSEGDKVGIRGLIAAENYKLLLLLNGKNITNMVYEGAILELDQWDLGDIERVEVVRGPGSVTYGTGAIAGVINIITKTAADDLPPASATLSYVPTYGSKGGNIQLSKQAADLSMYMFASYRETSGLEDPDYYVISPGWASDVRYVGKREGEEKAPQPYLADSLDRPQIKLHLDMSYADNFKLWARYTQSGQTHAFKSYSTRRNVLGDLIADTNDRQVSLRSFAFSPEYSKKISNAFHLKSSITYDNQEYIRHSLKNPDWDAGHIHNILQYAFSQERLVGSALLSYDSGNRAKWTIGYEYTHTNVNAPWGEGDDHIWIHEGVDFVSSANSSVYLTDTGLNNRPDVNKLEEVGSGLSFETHTNLLEASYQINDPVQVMYSHRIDWSNVSDPMYSPRLSLISELNAQDTLRLSAQRSLRMMPLRAQYLYHKYEGSSGGSEHESLDSLELAYTNVISHIALLDAHLFYNDTHAVGYTGTDLQFLADVETAGLELEARLNIAGSDIIFNYAYLKLLDLQMNPELKDGSNRNNLSFSDYQYNTTRGQPLLLESYGSGLNNWANHSARFLITHSFLEGGLIAHANTQVFWGMDGSYDEMRMYQRAYDEFDRTSLNADELASFNEQEANFNRERTLLDREDAYKFDVTLNASLAYRWTTQANTSMEASLYIDNVLDNSKRYYVSTGSKKSYPERLSFMEKERVFGARLKVSL